ncbi:hypothetical protein [Pseudomonas sp.]|uniref:hypothetical protein n=1 Tax=Pseudomonas sp. TaxID=306 RepID=UPI002584315C|nr:hypothetical protein [Pseudomonas sp.]
MTDIDPKALEHACQCAGRSVHHFDRMALDLPLRASIVAHARAIEQHEDFKLEVSDAVESRWMNILAMKCEDVFSRFILAKPDPLVEALIKGGIVNHSAAEMAADLRAAIEARGGRIVWEGE